MAFSAQINGQVYQGEDERKVEQQLQQLFDDFVDLVEEKLGRKVLVNTSFSSNRGNMAGRPMAPGTAP